PRGGIHRGGRSGVAEPQRDPVRAAISGTGGDASSCGGEDCHSGRRDRGAGRSRSVALPPDSAADFEFRPELDRAPLEVDAGDLFRIRPSVPGRVRSAAGGAGEASGVAGGSAKRRRGGAALVGIPGGWTGNAGGGAGEPIGRYYREARE